MGCAGSSDAAADDRGHAGDKYKKEEPERFNIECYYEVSENASQLEHSPRIY
jgi:hypothetical protein